MTTETGKTPEQKRATNRTVIILGALAVALYLYTVLLGWF